MAQNEDRPADTPPLPLRERVGVRGRATLDRWRSFVTVGSTTVERPLIRLGFAEPPSPARGEGKGYSPIAISEALPPAAAVLIVTVCSVAKRAR